MIDVADGLDLSGLPIPFLEVKAAIMLNDEVLNKVTLLGIPFPLIRLDCIHQ